MTHPLMRSAISEKDIIRFWQKVEKTDTCWLWKAGKEGDGYGGFAIAGVDHKSHRVAWTLEFGDIPDGMKVLHTCDNRACCNPKHLFLGTQRENMKDMIRKGRRGITTPKKPRSGKQRPGKILTDGERLEIRARYNDNDESSYRLAKVYDVSQSTIHRIATRETP